MRDLQHMVGRVGWEGMTLLVLIGLQAWSLQRIAHLQASVDALREAPEADRAARSPSPVDAAMAASLARIEARLAALESPRDPHAMPKTPVADAPVISPAAADTRLASLLPASRSIDDRGLFDLQIRIAQLPADQREAVSLALARAINSGRLSVVP